MIGIDWLRRKAAGAVRISDARPTTVTLTIDNRDSRYTTPTGFVRIDRALTEDEASRYGSGSRSCREQSRRGVNQCAARAA